MLESGRNISTRCAKKQRYKANNILYVSASFPQYFPVISGFCNFGCCIAQTDLPGKNTRTARKIFVHEL